jgi:hypothetical protein
MFGKKKKLERVPEDRQQQEGDEFWEVLKFAMRWIGGPIGLALACVVPGWTLWPDRVVIGTLTMIVWLLWGIPHMSRRLSHAVGNRAQARRYQPYEEDGIWAATETRNAPKNFAAAGLIQPDRQDRTKAGFVPRIIKHGPYPGGVEMWCSLPPGMPVTLVASKLAELQSAFRAQYEPVVLPGRHGAEVAIRWPRRNPLDGDSPRVRPRAFDDSPWDLL